MANGSADGVCVLYRPTAGWYSQGSQVSHAKGAVEMMLGCSPVAFFHPHPPCCCGCTNYTEGALILFSGQERLGFLLKAEGKKTP